MKKINQKSALIILVLLITVLYIIFNLISEDEKNLKWFLSTVSKIVTIISFFIMVFIYYGWKFKFFRKWLVLIPNLNGIWFGEIYSTWKDPKTKKILDPIKTKLIIKQNLFHISCNMKTNEMESNSVIGDLLIDNDNQKIELYYTYRSTPNATVRERSPMHYGSIMLEFVKNELTGNYWTDRKTTGCIKLRKNKA